MIGRLDVVVGIEDEAVALVEKLAAESHLILFGRYLDLEYHGDAEALDVVEDLGAGAASATGRVHREMLSVQIAVTEVPESEKADRAVLLPVSEKDDEMESVIRQHSGHDSRIAALLVWETLFVYPDAPGIKGVRGRCDSAYIKGTHSTVSLCKFRTTATGC